MNSLGLIHYWPIENDDLKDHASNADMIHGANYEFCPDRFNNSNSALNFKNGYKSLANGVYFDGDFTITVWINYNKFTNLSRILEVSNNENHLVALNAALDRLTCPSLTIMENKNGNGITSERKCNLTLAYRRWNHLAISFCGSTSSLFINGELSSKYEHGLIPSDLNGTRGFIGRNSIDGVNLQAKIDDLRVYKRCLSQNEIMASIHMFK